MISSISNPQVVLWTKLASKKHRDEQGLLLIEGSHLIEEAKRGGFEVQTIGVEAGSDIQISLPVAKKISMTHSGSTIFGLVKIPNLEPKSYRRIFVCDGVSDPGNLGTIIRVAVSFGIDAVYLSDEAVDVWNDKVVRSSQGAVFQIPVIRKPILEIVTLLQQKGVALYATHVSEGSDSIDSLNGDQDIAVIFGNEGSGVSSEILELVPNHLHIDTYAFESLNVAIAAGIVGYHLRKKRDHR